MKTESGNLESLDETRLRLLKRKLGRLFTWSRPGTVKMVGPYTPEVFERFEGRLTEMIDQCRAILAQYREDDLAEILKGPRDGAALAKQWADFLANDLHYLERQIPEWHAAGFGHPDHVADFAHWVKMPAFDLGELTCLSVGINPTEFPLARLIDLSRSKDRPKFAGEIEFLVMRYELYRRNFAPYHHEETTTPGNFIAWVDRFQEDVHPDFLERLRTFHIKPTLATPLVKKADKREIEKIAQLFTAMAIDQLGYNPRHLKSPIPKEISDLASSMGLQVTDETVRKYLRIGAGFIPNDWVPPKY